MTFAEVERLHWQVLKFIWSQVKDRRKPTLYKIEHLGYMQKRIIPALAAGRYVWEPGRYFAAYQVQNGLIEVMEAATAPGNMTAMIKALRSKAQFSGACWHRVKSGWKNFPRQESTCNTAS